MDYKMRRKNDSELKSITERTVKEILENGHLDVHQIILYGSYARGDADEESDIDIMVLCNNDQEEADARSMDVFRIVDKVAFDNDIMIQTNVKNVDFFRHWVNDLPYFENIQKDGVVLYG